MMWQHGAWSYYPVDVDVLTCACAPSLLCDFPAQGPCSLSLGSSQSLEPPKHRPAHHSGHSRTLLFLLISVDFMRGIVVRHLSELGDVLIHRHAYLIQILKLLP
jgi:hypothetical protein